jgi:hypothetical protein
MMQEAVRAIAALSGKDVFVVAPSSSGWRMEWFWRDRAGARDNDNPERRATSD